MSDPSTFATFGFAIGLALLTLGFANRRHNVGVLSMFVGIVTVLANLTYYITRIL